MRNRERMKKGASFALVGLVGYFTGEFLPPEVFAAILGAFV